LAWLGFAVLVAPARAQDPYIAVATLDGSIDITSARYLDRIVNEVNEAEAELVVIRLNTPGGLADSTRDLVTLILESRVPVAVYVSPSGAQAASAGTFIAAAAHFAVMAPATNIGAASPIALGGDDMSDTLVRKVNEDTQAFIRSIAEERSRNGEALESTVTRARAYTAQEAVAAGIVDFVASDLDDLLGQIDGMTVETSAGRQDIDVSGLERRLLDPSGVERLVAVIANPELALILLFVGVAAFFVEFSAPGLGLPGVIGIVAISLAFTALGQLPVNWLGVVLILGALALALLEFQAPGGGLFAGGAVVAFVLGAFLLFGDTFRRSEVDIPETWFGVNPWLVAVLGGMFAAVIGIVAWAIRSDGRRESSSYISLNSRKALIGRQAEVTRELKPSGEVVLAGERWQAELPVGGHAEAGTCIIVRDVRGLTLMVERIGEQAMGASTGMPPSAL
jgi:membrane-bound serine protease (ClpP class)